MFSSRPYICGFGFPSIITISSFVMDPNFPEDLWYSLSISGFPLLNKNRWGFLISVFFFQLVRTLNFSRNFNFSRTHWEVLKSYADFAKTNKRVPNVSTMGNFSIFFRNPIKKNLKDWKKQVEFLRKPSRPVLWWSYWLDTNEQFWYTFSTNFMGDFLVSGFYPRSIVLLYFVQHKNLAFCVLH